MRSARWLVAALIASAVMRAGAADGLIVIGHPNLPALDAATLEKVYTGKVVEVGGIAVTAVNAQSGSATRARFLQSYLKQDEDKYTAYWIVRRYIGKGAPPREIVGSAAVIDFVKATPGAIAYIDAADAQPGVRVLLR
jgi:ABC-type phosphate transport system substrate-binding protein